MKGEPDENRLHTHVLHKAFLDYKEGLPKN